MVIKINKSSGPKKKITSERRQNSEEKLQLCKEQKEVAKREKWLRHASTIREHKLN